MRLRLRTRIALSFALLSFVIASVISAILYLYASDYLIGQRQNAALTRAVLDARAAANGLATGASPEAALALVPSVGTSVQLLNAGGEWFGPTNEIVPDRLPEALLAQARPSGASQRIAVAGTPWFAVAIPAGPGMYVEVFPLRDLDAILRGVAWVLIAMSLLAAGVGWVIGRVAFGRILGPVRRLGGGARRIADGQLDTRIPLTGDPDLDPIASSFNEMAHAVQERIEREQRFSANVSHELRSPLTAIQGTAELLESRGDRLPDRERSLVVVLGGQVRRLSQMLLDLLEISRIQGDDPAEWEMVDVASLCREVLAHRGLAESLVVGAQPLLRTDARRLERIVGNLVDNAERHGHGVVQVGIVATDRDVVIYVDDAGPGIEDDVRERLFEPFARGSSAEPTAGAGLGLAIVREQAGALGGAVIVEASPQLGARFTARLPVTEEAT
ncbi:MAG: HAMP domain-containing sensor histidine kinase [Actinomycetota bacterium]|nr:HAMP domain-containing sensor histidine kinase [Actinomycetota bacterium]